MTQPLQPGSVLQFGVFEVDLRAGELRRNGIRVRLQEKAFQLLSALLEQPGEILAREDLEARLWPDVEVDVAGSLGEHVHRLRRALDDSAHHPRYIETIPKRGYRFIGTLTPVLPEPPRPDPPASSFRNWWLTAAIALGGVALAAAVFSSVQRPEPIEPPPRRFSFPVEKLTVDARTQPIVAISPDGEKLVFGADHALWLQQLDELWNPRKLLGTESKNVVYPAWSPDSRRLAFVKLDKVGEKELWRLDVPGGTPRLLAKVSGRGIFKPVWNPNSRSVLLAGGLRHNAELREVLEVALEGGAPEPKEWLSPNLPSLFPRGSAFGMLGEAGHPYRSTVVALRGPGDQPRELSVGRSAQYAPSGHVLFERIDDKGGVWAVGFSAEKAQPTGDPFMVAQGGKSPSVSNGGTLVYVKLPEDYDRLLLLDNKGEPVRHIGQRQRYIAYPSFSPDGKRVAVWAFEEATDDDWMVDIWIHAVDRPTKNRLTNHAQVDLLPQWMPDGKGVSFSSDRGGHNYSRDLYLRAADSSRPAELLWQDDLEMFVSDWSADGRRALVWADIFEAEQGLHLLDLDKNEMQPLLATPFLEMVAAFSPDERYIAFVSDRSGEREVWGCPIDNCGDNLQRVSTKGGYQIRWAKEEGALYYVEDRRRMMRVEIQTQPELVIAEPEALFDSDYLWLPGSGRLSFYDVTDDGEQFVVVDPARTRTTKESPGVIHFWQNWAAEFRGQQEGAR